MDEATAQLIATVASASVNKGGNFPIGQQGTTVSRQSQTFDVRNGQIVFNVDLTSQFTAKCQGKGLQTYFQFTNIAVIVERETLPVQQAPITTCSSR